MTQQSFDDLLHRLAHAGIAPPASLVGCTEAEIASLEAKYNVTLPATYRTYLTMMGHDSGRLLTHDHYAATYSHVLDMTTQCREDRDEFPDCGLPTLPPDALVIVGRLGEQFMMIRCSASDDSPVWYFNEYDGEIKQSFGSVLDWLDSLADEAENAIANGYYKQFPNGTRP
ncbi:SMI1/KNR4 family protein [Novipirellula rosea]|uniref:Knr4/Smi1-like domain-containing protein n=1 Tax=Novipirellula rosea TaxID=1031540 RepID=A0ABP8NBB4_9BACT